MHKILILLLLSVAISTAQDLITEADTIWTRSYGKVTDLNFSHDGTRLVVTEPGAYYVYDSFTGEELFKVYEPGSEHYLKSIITSDNKNVIAKKLSNTLIHNIETDEIAFLSKDGEPVEADLWTLAYNPHNNILYTFDKIPNDKDHSVTLQIWDMNTFTIIDSINIPNTRNAVISNDGKLMAIGIIKTHSENEDYVMIYNIEDKIPQELIDLTTPNKSLSVLKFSDDDSKLSLLAIDKPAFTNEPAYYDIINDKVIFFDRKVEDDYRKNGLFYNGCFLYRDSDFFLKSYNFDKNEISMLAEIRGGFIKIGEFHCVIAEGTSLLVFNKDKLINNLSVDQTETNMPFSIENNFIMVKPDFNINIYYQDGSKLNLTVENNVINRADLPVGLWFISIEGENYHKVIKLYEED